MKTEKAKMLAGELYDPQDPHLSRERLRCRDLCRQYNDTREDQKEQRRHLLSELFGMETDVWVEPPFYCDHLPRSDHWRSVGHRCGECGHQRYSPRCRCGRKSGQDHPQPAFRCAKANLIKLVSSPSCPFVPYYNWVIPASIW